MCRMNRVLNGIAAAVFALALAGCRHGNDGSYTGAAVYTVTFDSRGGSAVAAQTVLKGGKATQPVAPVRSGCLFADWYKDAAYAAAWNFGADTVTGQTTLYAKWHVVSISIDPHPASVAQGRTQRFTAALAAEGDTALWSLDAPHHPGTHISADGDLFVAAEETAAALTIRAASKADSSQYDAATVKVGTVFDGSDYASSADALAELKAHIAATQGGWTPEYPINLTL
ncbi:InlB B-repeat-containing protein, partial [Treponema endosymbiont of Eucomonympha sp.]|uniref:InlB B-repeat-containing protein n=1 Tax=Treponema endosymbiont of Eucomonympha sp. TaxID=1580831 RepID=UPI0013968E23